MQPAPLTGTATFFSVWHSGAFRRCNPHPSRGRQQADANGRATESQMQPAPPSRLFRFPDASRLQTGALPRNRLAFPATGGASPLSPSRGRQQQNLVPFYTLVLDAARTPYGDKRTPHIIFCDVRSFPMFSSPHGCFCCLAVLPVWRRTAQSPFPPVGETAPYRHS